VVKRAVFLKQSLGARPSWSLAVVIFIALWSAHVASAARLISLAPHLTEMVFDLGMGAQLVGVSRYSDFPAAASRLPRVGDAFQLNVERIINLAPDRILAWQGGAPRTLSKLEALGFLVHRQEIKGLSSIGQGYRRLGDALGQGPRGALIEAEFTASLNQLRVRYAPRSTPRVFLQIAENQLFTVSDRHYMGEAVSVCGGENVFSDAVSEVPVVTLESVLSEQPDVIVFVTNQKGRLPWQAKWQTFLPDATIQRVESDLLSRPSRRILSGITALCRAIHLEAESG
jgi:ABC-type Fe3+-hydroxamate transport system substrate-binding protein